MSDPTATLYPVEYYVDRVWTLERELAAANAETERAKSDRNAIACRVRSELLEKLSAANARIAELERNLTEEKALVMSISSRCDLAEVREHNYAARLALLAANQCGEQVGWYSAGIGRPFPMTQKPHESHKPESVYRKARA